MKLVPFDGSDIAGKVMKTATFTANGTWTKPDGVEFVLVTMCGGGASGSAGSADGGTGGGSGQVVFDRYLDVPDSSYEITVGNGGVAASKPSGTASVSGNAGGVSSFGSLLSTSGGTPNRGRGSSVSDISTTYYYTGGVGQDCPSLGVGGSSQTGQGVSTGYAGTGYGSGGGGSSASSSSTALSSGAGAPGIVIIKWFE